MEIIPLYKGKRKNILVISGGGVKGFSALGSDIGVANKYLNQNPFAAQAGMSLAKSAFEPEQPIPMAPAGQVSRGQPQPMDYMSLLNPQQQIVARPQPFSLI
jgi:hypothetical protein